MRPAFWCTALVAGGLAMSTARPAPADPSPAVFPLTRIGPGGAGYLADPQPIHRPEARPGAQFLSGTTKAIVRCAYPLQPEACDWTPLAVRAAGLQPRMRAAGVGLTNIQNVDLFQADDGAWHAAVTLGVSSPAHPRHWTVIAHAHPDASPQDGSPPLSWTADTLLAGSFSEPREGNYDAKYYAEAGQLYLLYVANQQPPPALRNAIVLQPMQSFTQAAAPPVTLLATGDRDGELGSETFGDTPAKLVEAPWIEVLNGKHALVYSTGSYLTPGYKAGVAWSDGLLPTPGGRYRKVLAPDPARLWHSAADRDVRYLLQSARPRWPNFVGGDVVGPGVAALSRGGGGALWLFFNGFAPDDMPRGADGRVDATHRRPFAVRMQASVPPDRSVAGVSDEELATWLVPMQR